MDAMRLILPALMLAACAPTVRAPPQQSRPGRFPAVSRTGRWSDVGHFTAIVWPTNRRIGCAFGRSPRWDVLVCRYFPSGNFEGVAIG